MDEGEEGIDWDHEELLSGDYLDRLLAVRDAAVALMDLPLGNRGDNYKHRAVALRVLREALEKLDEG